MVSYVLSQKQSNHLGLTPAIGASPNFSACLKHFYRTAIIIKLDNIDEKKVVYIEDTLKPPYDEEDWAEYPLLDLMQDADAPNEKWEINPDGVLDVAKEILDI